MQPRKLLLPALACATLLAGPARAGDDDTIDRMQEQIDALQSEVQDLRQQAGPDWLTEQRAEEIQAIVQDVLADADLRASLQGSGMTAGWDNGFFLESADGNYKLKIGGQIQVRFVYNHLDGTPGTNDDGDDVFDADRWGWETRRVKLKFSGHVVDPSWQYLIQGEFGRSGIGGSSFNATGDIPGPFNIDEAFIKKTFGDGYVRIGQFKGPFSYEELVSSSRQLAVERSLVNEEFNQDRSQGIEIGWQNDNLWLRAMYGDGFRSRSTPALIADTEWSVMGRVDWLVVGDNWKQFRDFTSWSGDEFGARLGAAFAFDRGEYGSSMNMNLVDPLAGVGSPPFPANGQKELVSQFTVDGQIEGGGWNLFASFVYRNLDEASVDQWGVVVQGGFFIVPDTWELFARYEYSDFDVSGISDLSVLTLGFNRYFAKEKLKWTTDIGYGFDEVSDEYDTTGAGWRSDVLGQDGQIVVRSQFQLLF